MSNDAAKARARRKLAKDGGKVLPAVAIHDLEAWTAILKEQGHMPEDGDGNVNNVRQATEGLIKDWVRQYRRDQADALVGHVRTGILARIEPEDKATNWTPTSGGHWSFKPFKREKGRTFSKQEMEEFLRQRADLLDIKVEGDLAKLRKAVAFEEYCAWADERSEDTEAQEVTEAQCQDHGMRIVGGG